MEFKNRRFTTERIKFAQQNAAEENKPVIHFVEGYDPQTKKDRSQDTLVWDRSAGGLAYSEDSAIAFCLPFQKEQAQFIADIDPYNRLEVTEKRKFE